MDEIKVGEYVRTREVYIGILIAIKKQDYNYLVVDTLRNIRNDEYPSTYLYLKNEDIVRNSKNIIDLIEVGDYVNGNRMDIVDRNEKGEVYYLQNEELPCVNMSEIKTILTKEQYNQNCYRLEE